MEEHKNVGFAITITGQKAEESNGNRIEDKGSGHVLKGRITGKLIQQVGIIVLLTSSRSSERLTTDL